MTFVCSARPRLSFFYFLPYCIGARRVAVVVFVAVVVVTRKYFLPSCWGPFWPSPNRSSSRLAPLDAFVVHYDLAQGSRHQTIVGHYTSFVLVVYLFVAVVVVVRRSTRRADA
jgi:hypothetical protein